MGEIAIKSQQNKRVAMDVSTIQARLSFHRPAVTARADVQRAASRRNTNRVA